MTLTIIVVTIIVVTMEVAIVVSMEAVPIIIIIYLGFIYLTYNPPHKFIFYDILNEKYGINEYKKIIKNR